MKKEIDYVDSDDWDIDAEMRWKVVKISLWIILIIGLFWFILI